MIIDDICTLIVAAGLGHTVTGSEVGLLGTDIYAADLPKLGPDQAIAIIEYPGIQDPKAYVFPNPEPQWEKPRIQVRGRGDKLDYQPIRLRMEKIRKLFMQTVDTVINDSGYARFTEVSGPFRLPLDEQNRPVIVMSFEVQKSFTPVTIP